MKKRIGTIDLTPSWAQAAEIYIRLLENGTAQGRDDAREGIREMAGYLDAANGKPHKFKPGSPKTAFCCFCGDGQLAPQHEPEPLHDPHPDRMD